MNDLEIVVVSLTSEYMSNDSENSFFLFFMYSGRITTALVLKWGWD